MNFDQCFGKKCRRKIFSSSIFGSECYFVYRSGAICDWDIHVTIFKFRPVEEEMSPKMILVLALDVILFGKHGLVEDIMGNIHVTLF